MTPSSDFIRQNLTYKVYRDNWLGAQAPAHWSANNSQSSSHWLVFNVCIHNLHQNWFPHDRRVAVLALLLTSGQSVRFCFEIQNWVFWFVDKLIQNSLNDGKHNRLNQSNYSNNMKRRPLSIFIKREWGILETRATVKSYPSCTSAKNPFCPLHLWPSLETASCVPSLPSTTRQPSCYRSLFGLGWRRNCQCLYS